MNCPHLLGLPHRLKRAAQVVLDHLCSALCVVTQLDAVDGLGEGVDWGEIDIEVWSLILKSILKLLVCLVANLPLLTLNSDWARLSYHKG